MFIRDAFGGTEPVFSFEFFPPKTALGEQNLYRTIEGLRDLRPTFVSVTCHAGASTGDRGTLDWSTRIKREIGIEAMAHLTCIGTDRDGMARTLDELHERGIENILPLRGDPPRDHPRTVPSGNGFRYAADLVSFIRAHGLPFCLAAAAYPEGHIECRDLELDLQHLKAKVNCGVDFLITQLFFDNCDYWAFVARARDHGITVPILPGIMPVTSLAQIERFTRLCGASLPRDLRARLESAGEDTDVVRAVGVDHAAAQCRDLIARGAPGIHFYTLNQSPATRSILEALRG